MPVAGEDGFPDEAEDEALNGIEDDVVPKLEALGGVYVGRITRAGMRSLFCYGAIAEDAFETLLAGIEARFEIRPGSYVGADPEHRIYKSQLYPTPEEWSVIHDMGVFGQLGENGDERDDPREITHWAYFPDRAAADRFAEHVLAGGYRVDEVGPRPDRKADAAMCVRFAREDVPAYGDFTGANIELRKAAKVCGGEYDGWETMVIRKLQ